MHTALLIDLRELTMARAYFDHGMNDTAMFELLVHRLRKSGHFLLSAGLARAFDYLEELRFAAGDIECLQPSRPRRQMMVCPHSNQ
jgi:nicotinate phosphoribosyltransferase